MKLSESQKQIIAELASAEIPIWQEQDRHVVLTAYGKDHEKDICVLVHKGLLELLPPDPVGKTFCRVNSKNLSS